MLSQLVDKKPAYLELVFSLDAAVAGAAISIDVVPLTDLLPPAQPPAARLWAGVYTDKPWSDIHQQAEGCSPSQQLGPHRGVECYAAA